MREIHAGSGHWSQDSSVVILAKHLEEEPSHLWVRWPGGKITETALPPGAMEVSVNYQDKLRLIK
jgi:hypothetical protein